MFAEKKIGYIDYLENDVKMQNAGYIKIEVKDQVLSLKVQVNKLPSSFTMTREIWMRGMGKEALLGILDLKEGQGEYVDSYLRTEDMGGEISYYDLEEIRIKLAKGKELRCVWRVREERAEQETWSEGGNASYDKETDDTGEVEVATKSAGEVVLPHGAARMEEADLPINKWQQLWNIYPHKRPFEDDREYLSIGPEDFVIMSGKSYGLLRNSFLLHGYYNYGHLILGKFLKNGNEKCFVGVPGVFHEKEKQAAVLYGFESFECRTEPANNGDFGYYMIGVDL